MIFLIRKVQTFFFFFFFPRHPLFQGWSHARPPIPMSSFLFPASHRVILMAEEPSVLACFRSTALLHRRLSLWACYRPTGCVELRSEISGPIYSGYVPFHTALVLPLQLPEIEVALLLKNPSDIGFPSNINCEFILSRLKRSFLQRGSNRGPLGRDFTKRTLYHCTSRPRHN